MTFDSKFLLNPFSWYAQMRREAPVHYDEAKRSWSVFRYADVQRVLSEWQTFSSKIPHPPEQQHLTESLNYTDPPKHRSLRSLVQGVFTPRRIESMAPRITEITHDLIEQIKRKDQVDLIHDFSSPLPVTAIAEILGVPTQDWEDFKRWSDGVVVLDPVALQALADYFQQLIDWRRSHPTDDLVSDLISAHDAEAKLTAKELIDFCIVLLVGGNETTTNLIANAVLCLHEHPNQAQRLREDRSLLPSAIEEVLRYRSPVTSMARYTTVDTLIGEQVISAGQMVEAWMASANRDELHFEQADRFIIDRQLNDHVAFGYGIHFCIGATLARLEARIALTALLKEFPNLRVDETKSLEPIPTLEIHGLKALPVLL